MAIDVPTLMLADAFVCAVCGAFLASVWWQHKADGTLWWAAGLIANGLAVALLAVGFATRLPALFLAGLTVLILAPALLWCGLRLFFGEPLRLWSSGVGFAAWLAVPALAPMRESGSLPAVVHTAILATFYCATVWELWRHKNESLRARVPLIAITVPYILIYLMAIPEGLQGKLNGITPPPLTSIFGFIHFYTLIYAIGATVFLVALVKERRENDLKREALTDSLTGLANRRAFLELSVRVAERCRRRGEPIAVAVFDLDHFKTVNDTFGHALGDTVLRIFANAARASLRPGDIISRVGGEEFFAVLPGANLKDGCATANRVRQAFAEATTLVEGRPVYATVSVGVMASDDPDMPLAALLEKADLALYRAKLNGRNCVQCGLEMPEERRYPRLVKTA